jgi:hypothetical protein
LLNNNSVDIDLAPLEAFNIDGIVPHVVEEDGDDDIDVEEVFDAPQPLNKGRGH